MAPPVPFDEVLLIRPPDPSSLFSGRAKRFVDLASRHQSMAAYLGFMARVAAAQQSASLDVPMAAVQERIANTMQDDGIPALSVHCGELPGGWRNGLKLVTDRCRGCGHDITRVLHEIDDAPPERVDAWARSVLTMEYAAVDPGVAAMIAAALQVEWTSICARLAQRQPRPTPNGNGCPVCGSLPVASVIISSDSAQGLRYLCCWLCSAQWNLPRIRCVHCGSSKGMAYYAIEGSDGAVRAEACDECKTYLKILNLQKDTELDPFADDLASVSLDILMAESGYARFGVNPFLIPGDESAICGQQAVSPSP